MRARTSCRWHWLAVVIAGAALLTACGPRLTGPTPAVQPVPIATSSGESMPAAPATADAGKATPAAPGAQATAAPAATAVDDMGVETAATDTASPAPAGATAVATLPAPAKGLTGVVWNWTNTTASGGEITAVSHPDRYTMEFLPGNRVRVRADCNKGTALYTPDGDKLTIQVATMTKAACHPQSKAPAFLEQIAATASYRLDGADLTLVLKSGDAMHFVPAQAG